VKVLSALHDSIPVRFGHLQEKIMRVGRTIYVADLGSFSSTVDIASDERLYTFVPNDGIGRSDYSDSKTNLNRSSLRNTKQWFKSFKPLLENRSTYRRQMVKQDAPYFAIYNVGEYTFKPWKVIWPEMSSRFFAAVAGCTDVPLVGSRPYVPDHKIYFAAFDEKEPAYYLCGLLNNHSVAEWIESHNISIQVGNVFKHLDLPEYDPTIRYHRDLAKKVEEIHAEHDAGERAKLMESVQYIGNFVIAGI